MIKRIDPHVHCRDYVYPNEEGRYEDGEAYKDTIAHVLKLAAEQGIEKIFDMPNTKPPIVRRADVEARLKRVPKSGEGRYFLYIGVTSDRNQLREAIDCYNDFPEVVGLKMFAGSSVGDLLVADCKQQRMVYDTLTECGYNGVLAVHCEKESLLKKVWDPRNPITHCLARPKWAEQDSANDQALLARQSGFKGTLHICHVTFGEVVDMVGRFKEKEKMKITCGVTPHHLSWSDERMKGQMGLIYKMNPPLRSREDVRDLRKRFLEGKIDWIETDHAPHSIGEKLYSPYMSGYPSMCFYDEFLKNVKKMGATEELIQDMTHDNIVNVFGNKLRTASVC